jgi:hypothetical protein
MYIPVILETAALLAALTLSNHIVRLCSWCRGSLPPSCISNAIGHRYIGFCLVYSLSTTLQAQNQQDPTRPQALNTQVLVGQNNAGEGGAVRVSAVFINGSNKHAIVNGEFLAEGQVWQGFEVLEINQSGVVLVSQEGPLTILIDKNLNIKKDSENGF